MAITTAFCESAKREFLSGTHLPTHTYKLALLKPTMTGTYGAGTTSYTSTTGDEVANGNGYTTGGATLTGLAYSLVSGTASMDWSDVTWASSSISAVGGIIYNDSASGKPALATFSFGGTITSTNGAFTVQIPSGGAGGLIKLS